MAQPTNQQLSNQIAVLGKRVLSLEQFRIDYEEKQKPSLTTRADLKSSVDSLNNQIDQIISIVRNIEAKLKRIKLPNETKFFLGEVEIRRLRTEFRRIIASHQLLDATKKEILSLINRFDLTNASEFD